MKPIALAVGVFLLIGCNVDYRTGPSVKPMADLVTDVTPPTLTALRFSPTSINTTDGPATTTVDFTVTDDVSGVHFVQVQLRSPSTGTSVSNYSAFTASTNQSGSFDVTFPQYSESGSWSVEVFLEDAAGNHSSLYAADLTTLGFPTSIAVVSAVQDVTPPTLTGLAFAPATVNTSDGPATATVNFTVTDDVSGAHFVQVQLRSPSTGAVVSNYSAFTAATSQSGSFDVTFPQYSESGSWSVEVFLEDAAGNHSSLYVADLTALGLPTSVTVANVLPVSIDIQPGSSLNSINANKQGKVAVAILGSADFDPPSGITRTSLTFGRTGYEASLVSCARHGQDVNGDGFKDLTCQFYAQSTGFQRGDVVGILRGRTIDRTPFEGRDTVRIIK